MSTEDQSIAGRGDHGAVHGVRSARRPDDSISSVEVGPSGLAIWMVWLDEDGRGGIASTMWPPSPPLSLPEHRSRAGSRWSLALPRVVANPLFRRHQT